MIRSIVGSMSGRASRRRIARRGRDDGAGVGVGALRIVGSAKRYIPAARWLAAANTRHAVSRYERKRHRVASPTRFIIRPESRACIIVAAAAVAVAYISRDFDTVCGGKSSIAIQLTAWVHEEDLRAARRIECHRFTRLCRGTVTDGRLMPAPQRQRDSVDPGDARARGE